MAINTQRKIIDAHPQFFQENIYLKLVASHTSTFIHTKLFWNLFAL